MRFLGMLAATGLLAGAPASPADARQEPGPVLAPISIPILLNGRPFPSAPAVQFRLPAARRTLFVDAGKENGDGSEPHPWSDLQSALCSLSSGDRLRVRAGTYAGEFQLEPPCHDGTESEPIQVVFDGKARLVPRGDAPALIIRRAHWQIVGLFIDLGEATGGGVVLEGPGAHHVALAQLRIAGGVGPGVRIGKETAHVTVSESRIAKGSVTRPDLNSVGIEIEAGARHVALENNRLRQNPAGSIRMNAPGPGGSPASDVRVMGNSIHDDGSTAIAVAAADGLRIADNTISDFSGSGETRGITLENVRSASVRSNHVSHCTVSLRLGRVDPESGEKFGVERVSVDRNYFERTLPGGTAIDIEAGSDIRVVNNIVEGYADGILVLGTSPQTESVVVANNLFVGISHVAFALESPQAVTLFDYNVFSPRGGELSVEVGGQTLALTRFLKGGAMPHSKAAAVEIRNRDLGRISGVRTRDAGKVVGGVEFQGSAPDLGVAER